MVLTRRLICVLVAALMLAASAGCGGKAVTYAIAADASLADFVDILAASGGYTRLPVEDDAAALYHLSGGSCQSALIRGISPGAEYNVIARLTYCAVYAIGPDTDIAGWQDYNIAIGAPSGSEDARHLEAILAAFYIDLNKVNLRHMAYESVYDALDSGDVDSALFFVPIGAADTKRFLEKGRLCPIPGVITDALKERFGDMEPYILPGKPLGLVWDMETVAMAATIVTTQNADEKLTARLREAVNPYIVPSESTEAVP